MTRSNIEMNFASACSQAKRIEEIADEMNALASQNLVVTMQEISACWKGESAAAYLSKVESVKDDILSTKSLLKTIAQMIRTEAKRVYDAEMAALRIAETRTYQ